jgi:hypothetical protein
MDKTASQHGQMDEQQMLLKIKENLRKEVLSEVRNIGLRRKLFAEYYDLAGATSTLLRILQQHDFAQSLGEQERQSYDKLMSRLSCCGLRTQILLEQSSNQEYEALLSNYEPATALPN